MKVLVTGGGGFIGSHLVESQLALGNQVRALDLQFNTLFQAQEHPDLEIVVGDLRKSSLLRDLVKNIDIVYHLASAHLDVTLPHSYYQQVNVDATLDLLQAAHHAGIRRFVHCSTNGVLGKIEHLPADETAVCNPTNIYEQTKLEGERVVRRYCGETGFAAVIIRPSWVYGPRCPRTQRLLHMAGKGRFIMFGDGQILRHPIYIADMIKAFELSAEIEKANGEIYFIAGEKPVTIEQLVQLAAEVQDAPLKILHLPLVVGKGAGHMLQLVYKPLGKRPPFSSRSLDFFVKDNAYDIGKAHRDLGFIAQTDLRSGLEKTLATMPV